ncbi:hypothetical protein Sango_2869100 [Sesamum angolense]|uniref:Uncharacterized protein n=1 Tax=Sesamum angolense TaxID=2727404 RepID=A0AAE1T5U5_9LAMI|nr:hypothetical protein Sango_2869100 [Sesamum angolense]
MAGREWISTVDENHRQYEFPSYWGVNTESGFPSYDSYSESYNPGWQNHFNYWDEEEQLRYQPPPSPMQAAPQTSNSGMSLEDIVKSLALTTLQFQQDTMAGLQETKACLQLLGNQISQLATSINKLEAQASQQTEVNPENASAMTPQSREELHMIEQAPADTSENEKTLEYTEVQNEKVESNLISPPSSNTCARLFPCSMPKSEKDEKEITLSKVKINITLLDLKALPWQFQSEPLKPVPDPPRMGRVWDAIFWVRGGSGAAKTCPGRVRGGLRVLSRTRPIGPGPGPSKLSSSWLGRFEAVNVFPHGVARIKSLATRQIFKVKGHRSKPFLGGDEVTTISNKALASLQQLTH